MTPDEQIKMLRQALTALEYYRSGEDCHPTPASEAIETMNKVITEIAATADQPQQEIADAEAHAYLQREDLIAAMAKAERPQPEPIDMILHCEKCGLQHIDAPDDRTPDWKNGPHRSHLCHGCGHIWRPADVPTNGVAEIKTKGKNDSPKVKPQPDCRTCLKFRGRGDPCGSTVVCINGSEYRPSEPLKLYRSE